jgi:inner membrane protein COX18
MQDCLYQIHDLAGIGWVPTIALSTIGIQLLVGLPIRVMQQQTTARLQNLVPELKKLREEIALEVAIAKKTYKWSEKKCKRVFRDADKKHFRELVKEHNCHPMRAAALGLVQVTPWISLSMAIRNIVFMLPDTVPEIASDQQYRYMQLAVENLPWLDSLVTPDPFILPGIFVLASLINIQLALPQKVDVPQKTTRNILPWIFRSAVVGVGVMGTFLPSAVTLYWAVSSSSAVALNVLLKVPYVRSVFGIPKTVSVNPQPQTQSLKPKKKWLKFPFSFKSKRPAV